MKIAENVLIIEHNDSLNHVLDRCRGRRFEYVMIPSERAAELAESPLNAVLILIAPARYFYKSPNVMADDPNDENAIPFDFNIETTTFTLPTGDYVRIERNDKGFFISGRINGQDWINHSLKDWKQLTEFLELHELLTLLSTAKYDRDT